MKSRTRFLALAVVTVVAITTLTACGPSPELTQARANYEAAITDWDAAQEAFEAAVADRDTAVADTAAARLTGAANFAELSRVLETASNDGVSTQLDLRLESIWNISEQMSEYLEDEAFGVAEGDDAYVPLTPQVPTEKPTLDEGDLEDYELFTGKLEDDIHQFEEATKGVTGEASNAESFINTMTGTDLADAYLADAPAVVDCIRKEVAEGIERKRAAFLTDGQTAAADALQGAIDSGAVTAQNLLDAIGAARN